MKKIKLALIGLTVGVLGLGLYGCANKYNSVPLHSAKYYSKHQKQMTAMINKCNKVEANLSTEAEKEKYFSAISNFRKTTLYKDCNNASAAQGYIGRQSLLKGAASDW